MSEPPTPRRLLLGPAKAGKTFHALQAVRAAATREAPRGRAARDPEDALLLLPTYAQVAHVKRIALSRWGARGIVDLPFATFTSAGERFLPRFRVGALPTAEERDRLMAAALEAAAPPAFQGVAGAVGFRSRLLRLSKELKQSGVPPLEAADRLEAALDVLGDNAQERTRAFVAVFRAYHEVLIRAGFEDHEDSLRRLRQALADEPPATPPRVLVIDGFEDFTPIETEILDALVNLVTSNGGQALITLPWDQDRPTLFQASAPTRAHLLATGFAPVVLAPDPEHVPAGLRVLSERLFDTRADAPAEGGPSVGLLQAGDADDEADRIARHLWQQHGTQPEGAARALRWHDMGVVLRDLRSDGPRLAAALERLGLPVRWVGAGPPLRQAPLVRALRGALEVLRGDTDIGNFDPWGLHAWLTWCLQVQGDAEAIAAHDAWAIEHRVGAAPAALSVFVDDAPALLAPWLQQLAAVRAHLEETTDEPSAFLSLANGIVALAPLPAPSPRDDQGRAVEPALDRRTAEAAAARQRLIATAQGLASARRRTDTGTEPTAQAILDAFLYRLDRAERAVADRRLDAVTLLDAETARYFELDLVVVAGLDEGSFPRRPPEDVLLRDADREALGGQDPLLRLPRARDREARERRLFYAAVTRPRRAVVVSHHAFDGRGDPVPGSPYLRELLRCVAPTVIHAATGPASVVPTPDLAVTSADLRRMAADAAATRPVFAAALAQAVGCDASTRVGFDARTTLAPFHDAVRAGQRFASSVRRVSASRLNGARGCLHRHFLARVLEIPEDDLSFEAPALDARGQGTVMHDAFCAALKDPDATPATVSAAALDKLKPEPTAAERLVMQAELERMVELLRLRDQARGGFVPNPDLLEVRFGYKSPVELSHDDVSFELAGQIDRVDLAPGAPSRAIVVDYKRSKGSAKSAQDAAFTHDDLQLPLYAAALEATEGYQIVGLEWIAGMEADRRVIGRDDTQVSFLERYEGTRPKLIPTDEFRDLIDRAVAIAAEVVDAVRAGRAPRAPREPTLCTTRCGHLRVCRPHLSWLARAPEEPVDK